jgi:cytochrome c peroxidase
MVKTAKYKDLYQQAWGEPIDCNQQGAPPAFHISFKRLAVAVAAWQGSPDVNSFSSPRDDCIRRPAQFDNDATPGKFPCANLGAAANLGHDLFYGSPRTSIDGKNAGCAACHNNFLPANAADGDDRPPRRGRWTAFAPRRHERRIHLRPEHAERIGREPPFCSSVQRGFRLVEDQKWAKISIKVLGECHVYSYSAQR